MIASYFIITSGVHICLVLIIERVSTISLIKITSYKHSLRQFYTLFFIKGFSVVIFLVMQIGTRNFGDPITPIMNLLCITHKLVKNNLCDWFCRIKQFALHSYIFLDTDFQQKFLVTLHLFYSLFSKLILQSKF